MKLLEWFWGLFGFDSCLWIGMLILVIIGSIYFILLDELIMGCAQRRIGPLNIGWYGFLSSLSTKGIRRLNPNLTIQ